MKNILTICLALFVISTTACNQATTYSGEIYMSENSILTSQLEENIYDQKVTAIVTLSETKENATLWIDGVQVATFINNRAIFQPSIFGDIAVEVKHSGGTISDTITLDIETPFIQCMTSENGDTKEPIEGGEVVLTASNVTFGSNDMIWAYNLRVPKGKSITFNYESTLVSGGTKLEVHYRLGDYKNRASLHNDDPYYAKFIDIETDKWISSPVTLEHGVYTLYVCPNFKTGLNYISVMHNSDFSNGTFSANYKSILVWPND